MTVRTKNFNPEVDVKMRCTCGHPDCDQRSINQETADGLQGIRDDLKMAMELTSGGRCPNHPDQAKKSDPNGGDHPKGNGVDVRVHNRQHYDKIALLAGRHGFNAIGDGLKYGFIHLGRRPENGDRVSAWGY